MPRSDRAAAPPKPAATKLRLASSKAPSTRRGRATRSKLVAAARDIFNRVGFSEVRITDITALAGVASGTFYTYFDSKEEIFHEVAAQVLREMVDSPRVPREDAEPDPARQFESATRRYFECVRANARIAHSIEEIQAREPGVGNERHEVLLHGVKRIERWIRRLQREGVCDRDLEPWPVAQALHAMLVSVAYDHLVHRDAPGETETLLRAMSRIWGATLGFSG